jgi:hypothetical protein
MSGSWAMILLRRWGFSASRVDTVFCAVWDMTKVTREYRGVRIVETHGYFLVDMGVQQGWEFFQTMKEAETFVEQRMLSAKAVKLPEPQSSDAKRNDGDQIPSR